MGISQKRSRKKNLYASLFLVTLLVTGCAGLEPYKARDYREDGPERGIFTGSEGEFIIYQKVDEPETGSKTGKKPDELTKQQ